MFTDTTIYHSLTIQLETFMPYYKNMDKDYKMTVGKHIVECICDGIMFMSDSYLSKDNETKLVLAQSALKRISQAEIFTKTLFDLKVLSQKQIVQVSYNFGQIKTQLYRWMESLNSKSKTDGVKALL